MLGALESSAEKPDDFAAQTSQHSHLQPLIKHRIMLYYHFTYIKVYTFTLDHYFQPLSVASK